MKTTTKLALILLFLLGYIFGRIATSIAYEQDLIRAEQSIRSLRQETELWKMKAFNKT